MFGLGHVPSAYIQSVYGHGTQQVAFSSSIGMHILPEITDGVSLIFFSGEMVATYCRPRVGICLLERKVLDSFRARR